MNRRFVLATVGVLLQLVPAPAGEKLPYVGSWSNGRGETLVVTAKTLRFADNRAVPYKDVTRATDGSSFELQIVVQGEVNAFPGKTLAVVCEDEAMKITGYASHDDYMTEKNPLAMVTWYKDAADKE